MLGVMSSSDAARSRREAAAARYRPKRVKLLLIAEAPPSDLHRYFYFDDVREQDSLFRHVVQAVLDERPSRERKARHLESLRARGVFLIDLKSEPKVGDEPLETYVPDLAARAVALAPDHVIAIKVNVYDLCHGPRRAAGLPVVDERLPFPGSGHQRRFLEGMRRALASIGWRP